MGTMSNADAQQRGLPRFCVQTEDGWASLVPPIPNDEPGQAPKMRIDGGYEDAIYTRDRATAARLAVQLLKDGRTGSAIVVPQCQPVASGASADPSLDRRTRETVDLGQQRLLTERRGSERRRRIEGSIRQNRINEKLDELSAEMNERKRNVPGGVAGAVI